MRRLVAIALLVGVVGCGKLMRKPGGEAARRAESTPPAAETKSEALATKGAPVAAMPSAPSSSPAAVAPAGTTTLDTAAIEEATGLTGAVMADGVFRITRPRGD